MSIRIDTAGLDDDLDERFRALSPWLLSMVARRFGLRRADAEDVVQESFIRLGRYSAVARGRYPRALLLKIATNVSRDAQRRLFTRNVDQHVNLDVLQHAPPASLVQPAEQTALLDLKSTILELPEPLRETFLLARFTPLTHIEIAARLGISTKTVEWRISKAVAICVARLNN
jgi:RNA polymerase sigma factor (sigma-70 family)